jgi:xylulokinase
MTEKFILAHDLGTTGNKASLFDEQGKVRASSLSTYSTEYPRPNWVEQNPEDWWNAVCTSTKQLLHTTGIKPEQIACISFSGQMMGCVVLDRRARPLRNALIWADTRAVPQAEHLISKIGMESAYKITGHRASSSYGFAKMMWVRDHQPEIFAEAYKFVHAKDFIVARLTGKFATDFSDAGGTDLYDLEAYDWSPTMLEAAGLDISPRYPTRSVWRRALLWSLAVETVVVPQPEPAWCARVRHITTWAPHPGLPLPAGHQSMIHPCRRSRGHI